MKPFVSIFKFFASLKLAVFSVSGIMIVIAVGTFVEARYDAWVAKKWVYESAWMTAAMGLFLVNLICSATDRFPWKKRHIPFLLAHLGLIILVLGSLLTQKQGIDGTVTIGVQETTQSASLSEHSLTLYQTGAGEYFDRLYSHQVDFLNNPPAKEPFIVPVSASENIRVLDFMPFTVRQTDIRNANTREELKSALPAVQFNLSNSASQVSDWMMKFPNQQSEFKLGPARIVFEEPVKSTGRNEIFINIVPKQNPVQIQVTAFNAKKEKIFSGQLKELQSATIPWKMPTQFQILKALPKAFRQESYLQVDTPTPLTTPAVQIEFQGHRQWVGLNQFVRLFTKDSAYILSYGQVRMPLPFELRLDKFEIGKYPGLEMAQSYQSHVTVDPKNDKKQSTIISMNEPLSLAGFTFYQASFQQDEQGFPIASVFSVNKDPGRWVKYFGSFLVVLGSILLFLRKWKSRKATA